jgi:hypothetical protein
MNIKENSMYFEYLFGLQKSGRTNMFGAGQYLQTEMGLDKQAARSILSFWMQNYQTIAEELKIEV